MFSFSCRQVFYLVDDVLILTLGLEMYFQTDDSTNESVSLDISDLLNIEAVNSLL